MTKTAKTRQKSNYVSKQKAKKLRDKLNYLIEERGVGNAHIAAKSGVFSYTIVLFRKNEQTITKVTADKLEKVLDKYKF